MRRDEEALRLSGQGDGEQQRQFGVHFLLGGGRRGRRLHGERAASGPRKTEEEEEPAVDVFAEEHLPRTKAGDEI